MSWKDVNSQNGLSSNADLSRNSTSKHLTVTTLTFDLHKKSGYLITPHAVFH